MYQEIVFKREDLYAEIWAEPIIKVAQKYSLSDVGLAKICKKLKIPLPGRGYWQKGQNVKPPLPALKPGDPATYTLRREQWQILPTDEVHAAQAEALIEQEQLLARKIRVPLRLASPHPLVSRTYDALQSVGADKYGRVSTWNDKKALNVSIAPKSIGRAMRILDALLKACETRGFTIKVDETRRETNVFVLGEEIEIAMEEPTAKVARKLTPSQQKELLENPWKHEKFDFVPTGQLLLAIKHIYGGPLRKTWSDGKKHRLEDQLNDFVVGLIRASSRSRSWTLKREIEERARQERELRRIEEERKIQEEEERIQQLLRDVEHWHLSKRIREYVSQMKQQAILDNVALERDSKLGSWIIWAEEQANLIDPLVRNNMAAKD